MVGRVGFGYRRNFAQQIHSREGIGLFVGILHRCGYSTGAGGEPCLRPRQIGQVGGGQSQKMSKFGQWSDLWPISGLFSIKTD